MCTLPTEARTTKPLSSKGISFYPFKSPPFTLILTLDSWDSRLCRIRRGGGMAQANRDADAHVDALSQQRDERPMKKLFPSKHIVLQCGVFVAPITHLPFHGKFGHPIRNWSAEVPKTATIPKKGISFCPFVSPFPFRSKANHWDSRFQAPLEGRVEFSGEVGSRPRGKGEGEFFQ